jgi:phosphatidylglycerol lysyltransferase
MAASVGALYVLMPADLAPSFPIFSIGIVFATVLGVVSHAPGALGIFEAAVVSVVGGSGRADLLAALLLYRLIYNITPCVVAIGALGLYEFAGARKKRASR